jgi:uncharacterized membrane protein (UPF0127 family)
MFLEQPRDPGATYVVRNATNGSIIAEHAETAFTRAARNRGLLGRDHLPDGHALLIAPCTSIHTWFMRFPIDVIFTKRNGKVVKTRSAIAPWRLSIALGAYAVVELPVGSIARAGVKVGDRLEIESNKA